MDAILGPYLSDRQTASERRLRKQFEGFVQKLVDSGRYGSKSEVLREAVRWVQDRETRLATLEASIARGVAGAEAGRTQPGDAVFRRLAK